MAEKRKKKAAKPAAERASKTKSAQAKKTALESPKKRAKSAVAPAPKRAAKAKKAGDEVKKPAAKSGKRAKKTKAEESSGLGGPVLDPVGDVTSGEARTYLGDGEPEIEAKRPAGSEMEAFQDETDIEASDAILEAGPGMEAAEQAREQRARQKAEDMAAETELEDDDEVEPAQEQLERPETGKLERLQKILSQAGVASRRSAEEMIVAGRVMVNGQVVSQLGSKADPAHDHIRVDGKLLRGAERHRYFVLNKPRGYVTTVSDPEGRPTVMQFFTKMGERLYPVGRLDYQSEGLLLMTNDGELANLLAKAGSGVEKTYLVKVAGQPTAEQLDRLREGVRIEKAEQGSERIKTAPARIREVREGENPWFEVVLIEGRNRELRKMFAAIGHFAEKIRRVGYGPLVLDVEPGKFRELTAEEVNALRLTAEGKMHPRRVRVDKILPHVTPAGRNRPFETPHEAGVPARQRAEKRGGRGGKDFARRFDRTPGRDDRRAAKPGGRDEKPRWQRDERGPKQEWRPREQGSQREGSFRSDFRGGQDRGERQGRPAFGGGPRRDRGGEQGARNFRAERSPQQRGERSGSRFGGGPRQERSENRFGGQQRRPFDTRGGPREFRGAPQREFGGGPRREPGEKRFGGQQRGPFKTGGGPRGERPAWKRDGEAKPRSEFSQRSEGERSAAFGRPGDFRGKAKPAFGAKPAFRSRPKFGGGTKPAFGSKPKFGGGTKPAFGSKPAFGARPKFGDRAKPGFGAKPVFGSKSKFGGSTKPAFGAKPKFGGKPGPANFSSGKFRGSSGGGSRPGTQRGGWKRG